MDAPTASDARPVYQRIVLKLSGEALAGEGRVGFDPSVLKLVATEVRDVLARGVQVALVVGGGNFIRGADLSKRLGIDEVTAHTMGILATVINGLALMDAMEQIGLVVRVMSSVEMHQVAEPYIRRRALRHLEKGRVAIFVAGTGSPYFSTDTAAALRAIEIGADALLMAKKGVAGVYDKDPRQHPDAVMFTHLDNMDIVVFDVTRPGNITRAVVGEAIGTLVGSGRR